MLIKCGVRPRARALSGIRKWGNTKKRTVVGVGVLGAVDVIENLDGRLALGADVHVLGDHTVGAGDVGKAKNAAIVGVSIRDGVELARDVVELLSVSLTTIRAQAFHVSRKFFTKRWLPPHMSLPCTCTQIAFFHVNIETK